MLKLKTFFQTSMMTFFLFTMLSQPVQAGMVGTVDLLNQQSHPQTIALQRQSIQQQLVELGVEQQQASNRVAIMSDTQISEISQKFSELPAGASAGGILVTIFVVFVITDVIGATDIFPFINPIK